ncbi:Sugar kinase of the NBD/HSP70 family, may contain an N-terminal HTH domain [Streptomyces sp. DvalAA-14]|uniref:ROK family protein n=1 Tax=unclassified Streptomyces TaxID=2593676 RepID=UPI00081BA22B|nr:MULTISPECIES: ROK family protein [unclassified Streptomyces]MYS23993.1 ROK family protein [Streptomyces sp. SID4948]SCE41336.1 Sugar kinase of the NBD/HSP70 family, may contain an N-terminal HTH domain [Streptomyces sp. DvalAA-14]
MDPVPILAALRPGERHVVSVLRDRDGATRRELAELTRLPLTTVTATVALLIGRGVLTETVGAHGPRGAGRPAATVRIDLAGRVAAAVQLGRTQQSVTLVRLDGRVLDRGDLHLDLTQPFEATVKDLADAVHRFSGRSPDVVVVSVAMPFRQGVGAPPIPMYPPGETPFTRPRYPRPEWLLSDPSDLLSRALGIPVVIENDINLAALGEAGHGVARGAHTSVYLSVVPGFGAGIVIGGRLFRGAGGVAGELAHISVREDGDLCLCGNRGCFTTARRNGPSLVDDIATAFGRTVALEEVLSLAAGGDVMVRRWLTDLGRSIARPLIGFVTMLNPDLLVVDSALGPAAEAVADGLRETIEHRTSAMTHHGLDVRPGVLTNSAVPAGAAVLAAECYIERLLA